MVAVFEQLEIFQNASAPLFNQCAIHIPSAWNYTNRKKNVCTGSIELLEVLCRRCIISEILSTAPQKISNSHWKYFIATWKSYIILYEPIIYHVCLLGLLPGGCSQPFECRSRDHYDAISLLTGMLFYWTLLHWIIVDTDMHIIDLLGLWLEKLIHRHRHAVSWKICHCNWLWWKLADYNDVTSSILCHSSLCSSRLPAECRCTS